VPEPKATSFEVAQQVTLELPRELLRDVASNLKSLAKILPYAEYAAIVQRIAELRWRCALAVEASVSTASHPALPNGSRIVGGP
jgi:hypothetical protein